MEPGDATRLVDEAIKKAAVAWIAVDDGPAQALWCLPLDGALYLVSGPGEQPAPTLVSAAMASPPASTAANPPASAVIGNPTGATGDPPTRAAADPLASTTTDSPAGTPTGNPTGATANPPTRAAGRPAGGAAGTRAGGSARVTVTLRGDHGGRIVTWVAIAERLDPAGESWATAVPQLAAKRLNAPDTAGALVERWAAECTVIRLAPAGEAVEAGASLPDSSLAAEPRPTPATRRPANPFRLHRIRK